jgi:hypothetical protein
MDLSGYLPWPGPLDPVFKIKGSDMEKQADMQAGIPWGEREKTSDTP